MPQFRLVDEYRYWWPVTVDLPDPDRPGKRRREEFKAEFVALTQDEAVKLDNEIQALTTADEIRAHEGSLLVRVVQNWAEVVGEDGSPMPFNEAALRQGLQFSWFRMGLYRAYQQSLSGDEARLGN